MGWLWQGQINFFLFFFLFPPGYNLSLYYVLMLEIFLVQFLVRELFNFSWSLMLCVWMGEEMAGNHECPIYT